MENQKVSVTKNLLPIIELFKKSFDTYWGKIWLLAGIILFGFLGILIALPFALIAFLISHGQFSNSNFNVTLILFDTLLILIGVLFCIIFGLWSRVSLFCAVMKNNLDFKQSLSLGWKKIASFFWISLLVGFATLGGLIVFVIPGIIFAVWFCFSLYIFIAEDTKGISALKQSKKLVQGIWWPIFGRLLVLGIVAILISWIKFFGPIINIFFMAPFSIVFMYALYQDVKRVKS